MNYLEEFEKRLLFRRAGRMLAFIDVFFILGMILIEVPLMGIIVFGAGFTIIVIVFSSKYSCPKCEKRFDILKNIDEYEYCPFCGEHIFIVEENDESM